MDSKTIKLVQGTFEKVVPIADKAAEIFYDKLFDLDPSLKPLPIMKKLMTMIGTAVNGLNNLEAIVPAVQNLGRNHVGYGVKDSHYETVGTALIYTLETGLGKKSFTPDVKNAWVEVYTVLATTMKDATKELELVTPDTKKPWWKFW